MTELTEVKVVTNFDGKGFGQESLEPQKERIVGKISYVFAWIAGVININSFMMGASLVPPTGALNLMQANIAMLLGVTLIAIGMTFNGQAGHKYGIPYIVHTRPAFGFTGALFPGLIRAVPAICWYGIQSWIGAGAINVVFTLLLGFNNIWVCFIGFQAIQIALSMLGFKGIKWVENIGAVFIILVLVIMFYVIYQNFRGDLITNLVQFKGTWGLPFWSSIITFGGTYLTYIPSMGDISRELDDTTSTKAKLILHWIGTVPFTWFMALIGLMTSSVTGSWDPIALFTQLVPNKMLLVATMLFIAFAQVTTNVLHNVVPVSYVLMQYTKLDYKKSALAVGLLAMATMPWKLVEAGAFIKFIQVAAAFLAPIAVVMIYDYYVMRKQKYDIKEMYDPKGAFAGINWQGIIACIVGAIVALIFVDFAWIASVIPTAVTYGVLSKYFPINKKFLKGTIYEVNEG